MSAPGPDEAGGPYADDLGLDAAEIVRDELAELLDRGGALTVRMAEQYGQMAGRSARTIYRWADELRQPLAEVPQRGNLLERLETHGRHGFVFDDVALGLYYLCGGNMRRLRNELIDAGYDVPSEATLSRRLRRQVNKAVRDGARTGHRNRHSSALHVRHSAEGSNDAFQVDEFHLDIDVADGGEVIQPRLLALIDDKSRFIVAWALLREAADANDVLALLADGFEVRPAEDGSDRLIGGRPQQLISDQGGAFINGQVGAAFAAIPSDFRPAPGYTPVAKGKVERLGQHVQDEIVIGVAGRRTRLEKRDGTDLMDTGPDALLTFDQALERTASIIHRLNYETPHSSLGNRTRIDAYCDGIERREVPDHVLAGMRMVLPTRGGVRKVHPDGLHVANRHFVAECLHPYIGLTVTVRVLHHRLDDVAAFDGAKFVGMVPNSSQLSEAERQAIVAGRRADTRAVNAAAKAARNGSRRVNERIATGRGDNLVEANDVPDEDTPQRRPRRVKPEGLNAPRTKDGAPVPGRARKAKVADVWRDVAGLSDHDAEDPDEPTEGEPS